MENKISEELYEPLSPRVEKELNEKLAGGPPYWLLLGMKPVIMKKGFARLSLDFGHDIQNLVGGAHGGAIFSLADSAGGIALFSLVKEDEFYTTVEMKINYIRPFSKGTLTADGVILHKGAKTAVGEVVLYGDDDKIIAKCLATFMILKKDNGKKG